MLPHVGHTDFHTAFGAKRCFIRGAEDPSSPLDHVLHDGLGFEQVAACVEIQRRFELTPSLRY